MHMWRSEFSKISLSHILREENTQALKQCSLLYYCLVSHFRVIPVRFWQPDINLFNNFYFRFFFVPQPNKCVMLGTSHPHQDCFLICRINYVNSLIFKVLSDKKLFSFCHFLKRGKKAFQLFKAQPTTASQVAQW